ncbi:MAG: sel1 repeat family protein [Burkholderiales bacterium]|nr:sel1 repeat family protein [Burkholderiales bacterium]
MFPPLRHFVSSLVVPIGLALASGHAFAAEKEGEPPASFGSPEFMLARAEHAQGFGLSNQLYFLMVQKGLVAEGEPRRGSYTDHDLKQIIDRFDRIQTDLASATRDLILPDAEEIHRTFIRDLNKRLPEEARNFFLSKEVLEWSKRNGAFLVEALPLSTFVNIVAILSPEKFTLPAPEERLKSGLISGGMADGGHVLLISEALNSDALKPFIPPRFDLARLRKEEAIIRADAKRIFESAPASKYYYAVDMSLRESERPYRRKLEAALKQRNANVFDELQTLVTRMSYVVDPHLTGVCDGLKRLLDPGTIEKSNERWESVKTPAGAQIDPAGYEMQFLAMAYARGCYVKKNTAVARRVLEKWANSHHEGGKKAIASYCTLAEWYRFGIGGPKDEATAIRWEGRLTSELSGGHPCSDFAHKPLIDPADPWRVLQ